MAVGDILTLRVVGRFADQNIVNTLHYKVIDQAATENDILTFLCDAWLLAHKTSWLGRHNVDYDLVGVKAFVQTGNPKRPGFVAVAEPGTVGIAAILPHTCRTITLYTASANPRRRGRIMLSGSDFSMFEYSDGSVIGTERAGMQLLGDELIVALVAGGDTWQLTLAATDILPAEEIVATLARITPSVITSRRIRQFLIG